MPGLPFNSMPAAVYGTPRTLGNTATGRDEQVYPSQLGRIVGDLQTGLHEPVYTEADYRRGRDPMGGPVVEMAPASSQAAADSTDPFAALGKLYETRVAQERPLFDAQEQILQSQIGKTKSDLYQQYLVEAEGLGKSGLDAEQIEKRHQQLQTKYRLAFTKEASKVAPGLQELALKRQEWEAGLNADRERKTIQLQTLRDLGQKNGWDEKDILRESFQVLGISVPQSLLAEEKRQTPVQRLGELRPIYATLLAESSRYKKYPTGWRVFDEDARRQFPRSPAQWYRTPATPEQVIAAEDIQGQLQSVGAQIKELNATVGRRPSLVEDAGSAISPVAQAIKGAKPGQSVTPRNDPLGLGL